MHSKRFDKFAGIDLSQDPTLISPHRTPDAINILPDEGGHPEKRVGYRKIKTYGGKINGIFCCNGEILVHSGDAIYIHDAPLINGIADKKSIACIFQNKLWILTGDEFLVYNGDTIAHVRDVATIPQVLSQCDNYLKNGFTYQPFNLLTSRRRIGLTVPDEGMRVIYVNQAIDPTTVKLWRNLSGREIPVKNIGKADDGEWYIELRETVSHNTVGDEVILEYGLAGEREDVLGKCTFMAVYDNRLFLGGNPNYPNTDFYSETNDGAYFSDLAYTAIGTLDERRAEEFEDGTGGERIAGYSMAGSSLCIHKTGGSGASIYLRSRQITEEGAIYPITKGIQGPETITHHSHAPLLDDPLFLTTMGVFAIGSEDITRERSIKPRSSRVNPKLIGEENLHNALCTTWRGYYMVFINGRVYLADSRQRSHQSNSNADFEYEWYMWDNFPATAVLSANNTLYFGDDEGNIYRLNDDMTDPHGGYLMTAYNDDGAPIFARWSTRAEDDNAFTVEKLMLHRGSGVYVKTYAKSDVTVKIRTERDFGTVANRKKIRLFNFKNMNFADFTFNTTPYSFVPIGRKVKGYRMAQVIVENGELDQCLGIVSIEWHYKKGRFAK